MLKSRMVPRSNAVSAMARSMTPWLGDGREIRIRQASGFFDDANASLDRETQTKELDFVSWNLGDIRLERISLLRRAGGTHRRGKPWADDEACGRHSPPGASAYWQQGTPPDLNFRILIAAFDAGGARQFLTAFLPCNLLETSLLSLSMEDMVPLDSWQGDMLADHLLSLARELPSIPKEHWPMLGAATCILVQACLVPAPRNPAPTDTSRATALRERLRCVVRQNMSSPDFGPEALRRLAAMSRSKLYRMFEGTGGVARFIQDERLDAARQRLADIRDTISIRAVAGEVGFLEHSTFSRAFKLRYGTSPTEFREMVSAHRPRDAREDRPNADSIP
jgi:AraC-like DNA-binding protein